MVSIIILHRQAPAGAPRPFASALGTPPSGLATLAQLKAQPQAPAQDPPMESWSFSTDYLGRVKRAVYQRTTKRLDGSIHVEEGVPVDFADLRIAARFGSIIEYWSN